MVASTEAVRVSLFLLHSSFYTSFNLGRNQLVPPVISGLAEVVARAILTAVKLEPKTTYTPSSVIATVGAEDP